MSWSAYDEQLFIVFCTSYTGFPSTWSLERTNGVYKACLKSTIDPGVEASNQLVSLAATNHQKILGQYQYNEVAVDELKLGGTITTATALKDMSVTDGEQDDLATLARISFGKARL